MIRNATLLHDRIQHMQHQRIETITQHSGKTHNPPQQRTHQQRIRSDFGEREWVLSRIEADWPGACGHVLLRQQFDVRGHVCFYYFFGEEEGEDGVVWLVLLPLKKEPPLSPFSPRKNNPWTNCFFENAKAFQVPLTDPRPSPPKIKKNNNSVYIPDTSTPTHPHTIWLTIVRTSVHCS